VTVLQHAQEEKVVIHCHDIKVTSNEVHLNAYLCCNFAFNLLLCTKCRINYENGEKIMRKQPKLRQQHNRNSPGNVNLQCLSVDLFHNKYQLQVYTNRTQYWLHKQKPAHSMGYFSCRRRTGIFLHKEEYNTQSWYKHQHAAVVNRI